MSDTELAAVIGVLGALLGALLTAIAQPLITAKLSSRPRVTVQIKKSNFSLPQLVAKSLQRYRDDTARQKLKPDSNDIPIFNTLRLSTVLYEVTVQNSGKVTCKNIALNVESDAVCQIGKPELFDSKEYEANIIRTVELGYMQPCQKIELTVWSPQVPLFRNPLSITGEDLHDVKYVIETLRPQPQGSFWKSATWMVVISLVIPRLSDDPKIGR